MVKTLAVTLVMVIILVSGIGTVHFWGMNADAQERNIQNKSIDGEKKSKDWLVPEGLQTPQHLLLDAPFQQGNRCGPNAMFILLRLLNKSVTYEEIIKKLPVKEEGCSLEDLRSIGQEYGVILEVRHLTPEDLRRAPKPLILHIRAGSRDAKGPTGHFTVITREAEEGGLLGVDTTNGMLTEFTPRYLARNFSGYALVPDTVRTWMWSREGVLYLVLLIIVIALNAATVLKRMKNGKDQAAK